MKNFLKNLRVAAEITGPPILIGLVAIVGVVIFVVTIAKIIPN